jgi:hypothetical protein
MNPLYEKAKDLILIRRTSDNKEFEEYPLIVQPQSVLMTDPANNVVCFGACGLHVAFAASSSYSDTSSFAWYALSASYALSSSYVLSSSYAITASYALNFSAAFYSTSASCLQNPNITIDGDGNIKTSGSIDTDGTPITSNGGSINTVTGNLTAGTIDTTALFSFNPTMGLMTTGAGDINTGGGNIDLVGGGITGSLLGTSSYALTASYALNSFGGLTKVQHMTSGSTWCTMSIVNGLIVSII